MRAPRALWALLLASGVATFAAAQEPQTLGGAVSRLEAGLAAGPEAAAAGPAATARYAAGIVGAALALWEQSRHLDTPYFARSQGIDGRAGLANPDNIYESALIVDSGAYRVRGRRGTHAMLTLQLLDAYPVVALGRNLLAIDLDAEGVRPGEDFELWLGGAAREERWFALPRGARALLLRQSFEDWSRETPSAVTIERLDAGAPAVDAAVPGASAADYVAAADRVWNGMYLPMIRKLPVNALPPVRASDTQSGGLGGQLSVMARYRLAPDEALLVTVKASRARYQGIQLGDPWFVTPNWLDHQSSLTRAQAAMDADGRMRFVISLRDPGVANWLDPAGFGEGYVFMRWQGLPEPLTADEAPAAQLLKLDQLPATLPPETRRVDAAGRAAQLALRARAPIRR
jgi:hypothetical protein